MNHRPNVVYVFADQWRAQATGYAGDPNVSTPNLDRLAAESLNLTHAVAGVPVCTPARAILHTGQRPLSHGVFLNDVQLDPSATSLGRTFNSAGYDTAYIGKWHIDGRGRSAPIPPCRRHGFHYWKVLECTHDYEASHYFSNNDQRLRTWSGYDANAQTYDAIDYICRHNKSRPFFMMISWGPPHNPYETAPEEYSNLYNHRHMQLRPNVPAAKAEEARTMLAGYYSHCSTLDSCIGELLQTIDTQGLRDNTIFIFTSDHGDMLGSQGQVRKQKPWDESIRVPFLLRYPARFGDQGHDVSTLIDTPDIMPTLLGLCEIEIPESVEGWDFSSHFGGSEDPSDGAALLACYHPFGEWQRANGGREFRGLRTKRYTYVRTLQEPWLLYDNHRDPYQLDNLIGCTNTAQVQLELDRQLQVRLQTSNDDFLSGTEYLQRWGHEVDEKGTVRYSP